MKSAFVMEYLHPVDEKSFIEMIPYSPKYQGCGYGRKILLWALENIHSDRVILNVAEWNEKAVRLYKNTGFEIIKTIDI